jgi:hypothetical protein
MQVNAYVFSYSNGNKLIDLGFAGLWYPTRGHLLYDGCAIPFLDDQKILQDFLGQV